MRKILTEQEELEKKYATMLTHRKRVKNYGTEKERKEFRVKLAEVAGRLRSLDVKIPDGQET